jgi:hypothetical protein
MEYTEEQFLKEIRGDISTYIQITDLYNVLINKRNSEPDDIIESTSLLIAQNLISVANQPDHVQKSVLDSYKNAVQSIVSRHFVGIKIKSIDSITNQAIILSNNSSTFRRIETEFNKKANYVLNWQDKLKDNLLIGLTRVKVGGAALINMGEGVGHILLNRTGINQATCSLEEYKRLNSLINIGDLKFKLTHSD